MIDRATKADLVASIEQAQRKAEAAEAKMTAYLLDVAKQEAEEIGYFGSTKLTDKSESGAADPMEKALEAFAAEHGVSRKEAIKRLVFDALITSGYLAYHELDEDGDAAGHS